MTISSLIKQHAENYPNSAAIVSQAGNILTYGELFALVGRTVQRLNALGVGRNDRLAIVLPNGPEMAVAFLAVAAGATSAPLNPAYGSSEFDFYLGDLNARALLVLKGMETPARQIALQRGIPLIELSPQTQAGAGSFSLEGELRPLAAQLGLAESQDVALVLHTSGTTSRPKMVPLTQENVCASAYNICQTLALTQADRCLNVMPLFHIHGLMAAVLASIAAGGSVVCTTGLDARRFFGWMDQLKPTWYTAVPTMHQAILGQAAANRDVIANNPIRFLRSSSASLPPTVMSELEQTFQAPLIEAYGMTEAAHQMASNPLPARPRKPGSVGLAAGPQVAIMDETGAILGAGERGEIVIRGSNVMQGYESNPKANQSAFTDGWFRTGDQGYLDADGYLFITGRLKEMINRGGEKVTPREVDEVFQEHPAVSQAVTFAVPHPTLGEDVATAIVLKAGVSANEQELRGFALQRLAAHKVPSQVVIVDQIPKGPTGKLQRIGLYEKLAPHMQPIHELPRNDLEAALCQLWQEVLGDRLTRPLGIHENFFALGGDSLLATHLLARIRTIYGIELPLGTIFRNPTVEALSLVVADALLSQVENLSDEEARQLSEPAQPPVDPSEKGIL